MNMATKDAETDLLSDEGEFAELSPRVASRSSTKGKKNTKETTTSGQENTLDVVKCLTDSLKANFEVMTQSMTSNFNFLGENMQILSENLRQFTDMEDGQEESEGLEEPSKSDSDKEDEPEQSDSVKNLLASLEKKTSNKEKTGPKINETLATNISALMRQKPEEDYEKNMLDKICRPDNCAGLSKITVNQVIWDRISAEARTNDVRMQRVQTALVKGTTNVALIANLILKATEKEQQTKELLNDIWKLTEDSLVCLGAANWELAQRRRDALKPQISRDYSHLCAQKTPVTDMLFGENVTKQIKDITDDNKVTQKLLDSGQWRRGWRPNSRGSYRGRTTGAAYRGAHSTYGYGKGRTTPYSSPF